MLNVFCVVKSVPQIVFYSKLEVCDMATGGAPFVDSEEELHNWTVTNSSLDDRLNNTVRDLHRMSP